MEWHQLCISLHGLDARQCDLGFGKGSNFLELGVLRDSQSALFFRASIDHSPQPGYETASGQV